MTPKPSLYVHVPFCVQKCAYCGFYSHALGNASHALGSGYDALGNASQDLAGLYLEGLEMEIKKRRTDAPQGVSSLFLGGGTPSSLAAKELEHCLSLLREYFYLEPEIEKTAEGNPGTLTRDKLACLRHYGIKRFSLGVQSFNDELLKKIGRIHTADEARQGIELLKESGFENINLDLMFGLPGQDMLIWQRSVEESLSYAPAHLSLYGLTLEEGTPLYQRYAPEVKRAQSGEIGGNSAGLFSETRFRPDVDEQGSFLPGDDLQADMYAWAATRLEQAGYRHYETSNFALPGYECQHNLGYWRGTDYLGLGPGAVSCLQRVRRKNIEDVRGYHRLLSCGREPLEEAGAEFLSLRDCMAERVILGLRLEEGVNLAAFRRDFGADLRDVYGDVLAGYRDTDVFIWQGEYLRLAKQYAFVANSVAESFVGL